MRVRRRGMFVYLYADTPADDRKLRKASREFGFPLNAGYGSHVAKFEIPEDSKVLGLVLRYIFGEEVGLHKANRLVQTIIGRFKIGKEKR